MSEILKDVKDIHEWGIGENAGKIKSVDEIKESNTNW